MGQGMLGSSVERALAGRWRALAGAGVIVAAGVAAYCNTFRVPFVFDDRTAIVDNEHVRSLGVFREVLHSHRTTPVIGVLNAVNYAISGYEV